MVEHISFDELADYAQLRTMDDHAIELIDKVNRHLLDCAECRKIAEILLDIDEEFDKLAYNARISARQKISRAVTRHIDAIGNYSERLKDWLSNFNCAIAIDLKISGTNLSSAPIEGFQTRFFQPLSPMAAAGIPMSYGHVNDISISSMSQSELKDSCNAFNTIKLDESGKISVTLLKEDASLMKEHSDAHPPLIALVSERGEVIAAEEMKENEIYYFFDFEGIQSGSYSMMVQ
ncbi:MAG: hypothetical protein LBU32_24395 [Clostridiales bacterium]|jgi:hypothetical protein|nr:hypothetical protein [Clostridiales bacterium]